MKGIFIAIAFCLGSSALAAQNQSGVQLKIVPASPIVITGDASYNGHTIMAPWFSYQLQVTNNSGMPLTLVAVDTMVKATDSSQVNEISFTPSRADTSTQTQICSYDGYYDVVPADGQPHMLSATLTSGDDNCAKIITPIMYVGSNPVSSSYQYNVTVTPQGWFGTTTDAKARFNQNIQFKTQ